MEHTNQIQISLAICTYNRCRYLPASFRSIREQGFPPYFFEVIIIDNASTDETAGLSKEFISQNPHMQIRYCYEPQQGLSFARNRAIAEARAPLIAYVDDDVILTPHYLAEVTAFFRSHPHAAGAGGKVVPKYESGREPEWMSSYLFGFVGNVDYGDRVRKFDKTMRYPAGCNMIYKKAVLQQAGGFNEDLKFRSDDKYIFYAVKRVSNEIYYLPNAWLYHYIDASRLELKNFKTLFLKTGNEEKRRLRSENDALGVAKKFLEYSFKTAASVILMAGFTLKRQPQKGRYVFMSQWNTLKGFLKKDVFVR